MDTPFPTEGMNGRLPEELLAYKGHSVLAGKASSLQSLQGTLLHYPFRMETKEESTGDTPFF